MSDGTFNKSIPRLRLSGVGTQDITGYANISLPSLIAVGTSNAPIALPKITLSGQGLTGTISRSDLPQLILKPLSVVGLGLTQNIGSANITLPKLLVSGSSSNIASIALKPIALIASGKTGTNAIGVLFAKPLTVAGSGIFENLARGNISLPSLSVGGVSVTGNTAQFNKPLPKFLLSAEGKTGGIGGASITLPVLEIDSDGVSTTIGTASISLAALEVISNLAQNVIAQNENSTCYVMNTQTRAFTEYKNFAFNSFATFGGKHLAANANGIFELTGSDDDGDAIEIKATLGNLNMGSDQQKRMDAMYFWHQCDNDLNVRVYLDGDEEDFYDYTLESQGKIGTHANRVKLGKGMKAMYYQVELSGIGTNLQLDALSTEPYLTGRKLK